MNIQITSIANTYADSIIKYSNNNIGEIEQTLNDFRKIQDIFTSSPELVSILANPAIDIEKKVEILNAIFTDDIAQYQKNFLKILIEKQRFNEFDNIVNSLRIKLEDLKNEKTVFITSAVELNDNERASIIQNLENKLSKKVIPNWLVNDEIIGGLVIQIDDNIIDMSLLSKIENLSKNIIK